MRNFPFIFFTFKLSIKTLVVIVVLSIFYIEYFTYWMLPFIWQKLPDCNSSGCKKLLLVSDPQLIGPEWKKLFFMDFVAIWDSDRYIKRTFSLAENYLKPDIVIFLGDLMDQGYRATESEFRSYFERLQNVFSSVCSSEKKKVIFLPGDNDIGGIEEVLIPTNVKRFDRIFNQTDNCIVIEEMEFCKVNLMTSTLQQSKMTDNETLKVVLSHVSLIPKENFFLREVIKKIRPQLIFSGHTHESYHFVTIETKSWSHKKSKITPSGTNFETYKFQAGIIHEIMVPTCSYRMGVSTMGYGAAFVDVRQKLVHYNVLWLPQRYWQLFFHLIVMVPLGFFLLFRSFIRLRRIRLKTILRYNGKFQTFHL